MKSNTSSYVSSGVSYNLMDPFKVLAQEQARKTVPKNFKELSLSRGESAYVWEDKDQYRAFVMEGLGSKNLVADEMRKVTDKSYYDTLAQDTVAMIINDLIVVGAKPEVISAYFAVGDSHWFADKQRVHDLVTGWTKACQIADVVWGGGETPTLKDLVYPETIELAGSAVGSIKPKKRLTLGDRLIAGDTIVLIESNGIHANGLTLCRKLAQQLPQDYSTKLPNGKLFGEGLLQPTHIYARLIQSLFKAGIDIHYMVNITGHGWRKLMRARKSFTYVLDTIPKPQPIFSFIQESADISDREMYGNFNMGAGFAIFVAQKDSSKAQTIAQKNNFRAIIAGSVQKGKKQVIIKSKQIIFSEQDLAVR
ncbi:phosphoribosylformylglycinamidine cyclo-ligase [Candidatus Microgenomates bacterium]|nr:MAG: phosphoribosylformylglycinamidine cyclo-ligase [Candidatus Microgenomates bacterium]